MKPILITGGGGFLGAWIARQLLQKNHRIRIFDLAIQTPIVSEIVGLHAQGIDWVQGDIRDTAAVERAAAGCQAIIHLAALLTPPCQSNPVLGAQVNVIGTLNVFEAAKAHTIKQVVYASSGAVFGSDSGSIPYPMTQYGTFKLACEGSARAYWSDAQIASIGFRPTIVYGPGREVGLTAGITLACREAVAGHAYTIGFTGQQDFLYVEDAAAAFVAAALTTYDGVHVFSLAGGTADVTDVIDAIHAVYPAARVSAAGPLVPMASVIEHTPYDDVLGEIPKTDLAKGIEKTLAYYRARGITGQ